MVPYEVDPILGTSREASVSFLSSALCMVHHKVESTILLLFLHRPASFKARCDFLRICS